MISAVFAKGALELVFTANQACSPDKTFTILSKSMKGVGVLTFRSVPFSKTFNVAVASSPSIPPKIRLTEGLPSIQDTLTSKRLVRFLRLRGSIVHLQRKNITEVVWRAT